MGNIISNYKTGLSANVLGIILSSLNFATLLLTIFNWYSLYQGFKNMKIYDKERRRVIWFYYEITLVPLLVAGCGNYGARYYRQAIWIFPTMQIFLGFNFFWFLGMMYQSAGGHDNVKYHLEKENDYCGFPRMETRLCCKCCMRDNLWEGMKSRLWYLYLVYVKPLWAFSLSAMYKINYDFPLEYNYVARALVLTCTLVPLNAIKCFVVAIEPISRLDRIRPKLQLIRIMVPIMQIQQLVISWLVASDRLKDLNGIDANYRGSRIEGTLLSFEMLVVAMAIHFIYRAEDFKHWKYNQQYSWMKQPTERRITSETDDPHKDLPISELSAISAFSVNASSVLGGSGYKNNNKKKPLIIPEDHSLRSNDDPNYHSFNNHDK